MNYKIQAKKILNQWEKVTLIDYIVLELSKNELKSFVVKNKELGW